MCVLHGLLYRERTEKDREKDREQTKKILTAVAVGEVSRVESTRQGLNELRSAPIMLREQECYSIARRTASGCNKVQRHLKK
jgi:hypothetical protein